MTGTRSRELRDRFWRRHANPRSGWSRIPTGAVLAYALYRRNWRLLAAALIWTSLNPVLFSPPDTTEAWMTRAVLAERWWIADGNPTVGLSYPNICNLVASIGFCGAILAAWRQRPAGVAVGTAVSVGLKLWWLRELVIAYDEQVTEPPDWLRK